ncbi:thiamine diphosphate-binding fold containing protein [Trema orientale]|uniref:pyruvate decarboxylase n=1 Tax=Trema orientale TaxID=63057 RepID=A0A2P5F314_TREOI|nr:thiamine diphosphate-binding fold containing protein [Trema orientale]
MANYIFSHDGSNQWFYCFDAIMKLPSKENGAKVTAQDVSTMIRCGQKTIIFLINNGGYTIEVEIHDGPYNVIKNWNYTALVDAIHNGEGKCWTAKVFCEEELIEAVETASGPKKESLCFIEVIVHKDDTSKELLEWGSRVSSANCRPPNPQ